MGAIEVWDRKAFSNSAASTSRSSPFDLPTPPRLTPMRLRSEAKSKDVQVLSEPTPSPDAQDLLQVNRYNEKSDM
jgi:hypothetical protein